MRINAASTLTHTDVIDACRKASAHGYEIVLEEFTAGPKGGKSFHCFSPNGKYSTGRAHPNGLKAASWSAWGYVIAELFNRDPSAHIGTYRGIDDFIAQVEKVRQTYANRRAFGLSEREGEPGQDVSFLSIVGEGW